MIRLIFLPMMVATAGCASMGTKFDAEKAKHVRKVALLSVEILQEQPKDALGFAKAGELGGGKMTESPEFKTMSRNVFNEVAKQLEQKTQWQVVSLDSMTANTGYRGRLDKMESGFHQVTMTGGNTEVVSVPGVLGNASFRKMSHADKVKLAKELGADAYAEILVIQAIDQGYSFGNLTGNAAFAFTSRANLRMFTADSEEPMWQIQNIDGEKSPNSESLQGATKTQKLAKIGELSALSSIQKLVGTYRRQ